MLIFSFIMLKHKYLTINIPLMSTSDHLEDRKSLLCTGMGGLVAMYYVYRFIAVSKESATSILSVEIFLAL